MASKGGNMAKEVQMSIKMEAELRDQFMTAAANRHRPAAQIVRDLMRWYIEQQNETPNAVTIAAMQELDEGRAKRFASAEALFKDLGL
jgi:predicted DNA-binding protein